MDKSWKKARNRKKPVFVGGINEDTTITDEITLYEGFSTFGVLLHFIFFPFGLLLFLRPFFLC